MNDLEKEYRANLKAFAKWSELELLSAVIWAEAEGEPYAGKVGVGLTVQTRVRHPGHWNWGRNWREVILKPRQFSCFNLWSRRRSEIMTLPVVDHGSAYQESCVISEIVYLGRMRDYIGEPTHYHRFDVVPDWADDPSMHRLCRIGDHIFYTCFER